MDLKYPPPTLLKQRGWAAAGFIIKRSLASRKGTLNQCDRPPAWSKIRGAPNIYIWDPTLPDNTAPHATTPLVEDNPTGVYVFTQGGYGGIPNCCLSIEP